MRAIWKYNLEPTDYQIINIPEPAKILSVINQNECMMLYAEVETDNNHIQVKTFEIWIHGTGHDMVTPEDAKFIGTVKLMNGALIFHVFVKEKI